MDEQAVDKNDEEDVIPFTGMTALLFLLPAACLIWASAPLLSSIALFAILWVLAVIDWHSGRLPNIWTFLFLASGLAFSYIYGPLLYREYLIGTAVGFLSLFILSLLYKGIRGRDGMGMGDAKFMAGAGAWLGWQFLPFVLLIASLAALIFVAVRTMMGETYDKQSRLPFGPFLCVSVWSVWVFIV